MGVDMKHTSWRWGCDGNGPPVPPRRRYVRKEVNIREPSRRLDRAGV
jgi:hypothetical protein